jgi:hypothetical protein
MKKWLFISLLLLPAIAWATYKPARVLAPGWVAGVNCISQHICIDDQLRITEADGLYKEAVSFVETRIDSFKNRPRVIFCSTGQCYKSFGFNRAAGHTVGRSGIVIGPRGWQDYYVRHEMIHHLQAEKMGMVKQWRSENWFKEGMAYSLSQDPRTRLSEPMHSYRVRFEQWYESTGKGRLWQAAQQLW